MMISHTISQWILDSFAVIDLKSQTLKIQNGGSNMVVTYSKVNNFFIFLLRLAEKLLLGDSWDHWKCLFIQILRWRIQYGGHVYVFPWKLGHSRPVNLKTITRVFRDYYEFV